MSIISLIQNACFELEARGQKPQCLFIGYDEKEMLKNELYAITTTRVSKDMIVTCMGLMLYFVNTKSILKVTP